MFETLTVLDYIKFIIARFLILKKKLLQCNLILFLLTLSGCVGGTSVELLCISLFQYIERI